jgi:hypothetical protein
LVGLFRSAVPQRVPVACAVLRGAGTYTMDAPAGTFHLFALGIPAGGPLSSYLYDSALRAGGQRISIAADGVRGSLDLCLRPPLATDPPILLTLPVLLQRAFGKTAGASRRET